MDRNTYLHLRGTASKALVELKNNVEERFNGYLKNYNQTDNIDKHIKKLATAIYLYQQMIDFLEGE